MMLMFQLNDINCKIASMSYVIQCNSMLAVCFQHLVAKADFKRLATQTYAIILEVRVYKTHKYIDILTVNGIYHSV